jgi:sulfoxide reductase heme-binding subunit YedZ
MWQVRWLLKPAVFILCLVPALDLAVGALNATGILQVRGFDLGADPVAKLLHTCGSWTLNFLMITLCMTPLKDVTHAVLFLRFRRMFGLYAFFYALLHVGVYVFLDQSGNLAAVWQDVIKRPYITLGALGLLLLIPLAVTSTSTAQRRLKRRWTLLHRLIYVVAILGVWHYWWQVKKDIRLPLLYAVGLALLLGFRLWKRRRRRAISVASIAASDGA